MTTWSSSCARRRTSTCSTSAEQLTADASPRAKFLIDAVFDAWLAELRERFAERILAIDERAADQWGRLNAVTPRKTVDSLIAATAHAHALTVVTRNTSDFEGCDVPLLNP